MSTVARRGTTGWGVAEYVSVSVIAAFTAALFQAGFLALYSLQTASAGIPWDVVGVNLTGLALGLGAGFIWVGRGRDRAALGFGFTVSLLAVPLLFAIRVFGGAQEVMPAPNLLVQFARLQVPVPSLLVALVMGIVVLVRRRVSERATRGAVPADGTAGLD